MDFYQNKLIVLLILFFLTLTNSSIAETEDIKETLEIIQKDLRTLERAIYSESFTNSSNNTLNQNSIIEDTEDVLTRHLLKLSEIEKQFQNLTNKYEEVNFKLDKLSSRLSKIQADNQLRFQELESGTLKSDSGSNTLSSLSEPNLNKWLLAFTPYFVGALLKLVKSANTFDLRLAHALLYIISFDVAWYCISAFERREKWLK